MAQANQKVEETLKRLSALDYEELFYQLVSEDWDGMEREACAAQAIVGQALVIKLPPNEFGFRFAAKHASQFSCCVTAIYSPAQALIGRAAGAKYLAVYVNRASRLLGDGIGLVDEISKVLKGSDTELIAASIKSAQEATAAFLAGAHHLTLSLELLNILHENPLSKETINQFKQNGQGLVGF